MATSPSILVCTALLLGEVSTATSGVWEIHRGHLDVAVEAATGIRSQNRWVLGSAPVITIGGAEGAGLYEFSGVVGAARLADGRIVVADASSRQLRFFRPDGKFLFVRGGPGAGPGELQSLDNLLLVADTIYAMDSQVGAHLYTSDGSYVRTIRYRLGPRATFEGDPQGVTVGSGLIGLQRTGSEGRASPGTTRQDVSGDPRLHRIGDRNCTLG